VIDPVSVGIVVAGFLVFGGAVLLVCYVLAEDAFARLERLAAEFGKREFEQRERDAARAHELQQREAIRRREVMS